MAEIQIGMVQGVDVEYADPKYSREENAFYAY